MTQAKKHKVFISFHNADQKRKDRFVEIMADYIVDKSVDTGDIVDSDLRTETIRQKIRDNFIADATVTVVLIGPCTWQRKHVDWEIGSSLRKTQENSRCGLLGILLPNHPNYGDRSYNPRLIPPRLADNCKGDDPYAFVREWPKKRVKVRIRQWIHEASLSRKRQPDPDNSYPHFGDNRHTDCSRGWQS